jgi:hypothetical protein
MKEIRKPERVTELLEKEIPPVLSYIGDGVLTKRGTLLAGGPEKIGKSFIALEMARALTTGANVFGHPQLHTEICRVLYIEQEIGELQLQKRVKAVMSKENPDIYGDRLWYMSQVPELRLDTELGKQILFNAIEESQANVVLLDPIKNFHSYDENSNTEIGRLFYTLNELKATFVHLDLSLAIFHHMRKPPQDDGRTKYDANDKANFRGANDWSAAPDAIWTMHRSRELPTPHRAWELKNRLYLRNDAGIHDWRNTVNRDNDLRVRYDGEQGKLAPLKPEKPEPPPVTLKGKQMGFLTE